MRGLGLELDEEAVDTLLGTATGEDFTDLVVATHTVRKIAVQLERLAAEPDAPLTAARRYYGVYLVMLRAMEHVHVTFVERIEGELVPRLAELSAEAAKLIERADAREAEGGDPELAAQTRQANQLTIRACELYTEFLEQQAAHVGGRIEGLRSSIEDAEVTYATLSISSEVAAMIRSGLQDLDALMELEPPQMARLETPGSARSSGGSRSAWSSRDGSRRQWRVTSRRIAGRLGRACGSRRSPDGGGRHRPAREAPRLRPGLHRSRGRARARPGGTPGSGREILHRPPRRSPSRSGRAPAHRPGSLRGEVHARRRGRAPARGGTRHAAPPDGSRAVRRGREDQPRTGTMEEFAAARALYREEGFQECGPFGSYAASANTVFVTLVP